MGLLFFTIVISWLTFRRSISYMYSPVTGSRSESPLHGGLRKPRFRTTRAFSDPDLNIIRDPGQPWAQFRNEGEKGTGQSEEQKVKQM